MTDLDKLDAYFEANRKRRAEAVAAKWAVLRPRERAHLREAAVMGYVQGYRAAQAKATFDGDDVILRMVLEAVDAFPDIYPILAALPRRRRVTKPEYRT